MTLEDLGYNTDLEKYRNEQGLNFFAAGRVIAEHKERYIIKTADREYDAEVIGNLRFTAQSRADFPAVGDWVAISEYDDDKVLIHKIFPRKSLIERQSAGKKSEKQIIASNIDKAFIVQAVDRDFNINRIERYLTVCHTSNIQPIIILSKIDLTKTDALSLMIENIRKRIKNVPVIALSNETGEGIPEIKQLIKKAETCCLLGSSGVGKSTLLNTVSGQDLIKTGPVSNYSNRGKHITTHRELHVLENGGIIIDNPGMREIGIADSSDGLNITFDTLIKLSENCKFKDCTHTSEIGCAVTAAVQNGIISKESYENYLKMEKEKTYFESTLAEKRKKDKAFGKMMKNYKKDKTFKKY